MEEVTMGWPCSTVVENTHMHIFVGEIRSKAVT